MVSFLMILSSIFAYGLKPEGLLNSSYKIFHPPMISDVFVPPGFDDTDNVEVTFMNIMPNSCYMLSQVSDIDIDKANKKIRIAVEATVADADICATRATFFPTTVSLGELPAGDYELEFQTGPRNYTDAIPFKIGKSEVGTRDNYEYAALTVNSLTVGVKDKKKLIEVNLPVVFPDGCYDFKEVRVVDRKEQNVIEVLPIVELKTNVCTQALVFKNKRIQIPYSGAGYRKLIHIRAANGFSVNRVVQL